ncbi:MAG TPA: nitrous-oxide reductase, partial [Thermaerobacter sp.]
MSFRLKRKSRLAALVLAASMLLSACSLGGGGGQGASQAANLNLGQEAAAVMQERGLSAADVVSALKTYVPSGKRDEYLMFASGGHSGQVLVIGVPSMRLLKVIGVFTPEPWQGYGYSDDTKEILRQGAPGENKDHWGDTHHPALSETNGEYDGQWLFIGDKANGRLAVVDLRDFETKQIVRNPLFNGNHGATFVTPNTEYVVEGSQYGIPPGEEAAPLDQYKERYRGAITFWKFDRDKGRVDPAKSFAVEVPPYWQDLCDAGKGES